MTIELWDFQAELKDRARDAFRYHKNVIIQSATGSGKTRIASSIIDSAVERGKTVFFNCHRRELVDQSVNTLRDFGINAGVIQAGVRAEPGQVQVASIDTLKNRIQCLDKPDLMIWDEAHHIRAGGWESIHAAAPDCYHLGLSATPIRGDNRGLDGIFDHMICGPTPGWLIENGYLAEYDLYSYPPQENADGIINVSAHIAHSYIDRASDRLAVGFAPSVSISQQMAAEFNRLGIPSAHIDGSMPKDERRRILVQFANHEILTIWNYNILAEGFDISANTGMPVTISCLIDCQTTASVSRWLQKCGRCLRKQSGRAVINDHAGNYYLHGAPCAKRTWSLVGVEFTREPFFQCAYCYHAQEPIVEKTCRHCDYIYTTEPAEPTDGKMLVQSDVELEHVPLDRYIDPGQAVKRIAQNKYIEKARAEKNQLREQLIELCGDDYTRSEIWAMKPKLLKQEIEKYGCRHADETSMEAGE